MMDMALAIENAQDHGIQVSSKSGFKIQILRIRILKFSFPAHLPANSRQDSHRVCSIFKFINLNLNSYIWILKSEPVAGRWSEARSSKPKRWIPEVRIQNPNFKFKIRIRISSNIVWRALIFKFEFKYCFQMTRSWSGTALVSTRWKPELFQCLRIPSSSKHSYFAIPPSRCREFSESSFQRKVKCWSEAESRFVLAANPNPNPNPQGFNLAETSRSRLAIQVWRIFF